MKTISELNNKWWYRLAKVIFSLIVFVLTIVTVFFVFQANKTYKVSDVYVKCNAGNKQSFYAMKDKSIAINISHYENYLLTDTERKQILEVCNLTGNEKRRPTLEEIYGVKGRSAPLSDEDINQLDKVYEVYLFEHRQVDIEEDNTLTAILYSIFSIFIWYIIFEIIKRTIYYVILGSINPKK